MAAGPAEVAVAAGAAGAAGPAAPTGPLVQPKDFGPGPTTSGVFQQLDLVPGIGEAELREDGRMARNSRRQSLMTDVRKRPFWRRGTDRATVSLGDHDKRQLALVQPYGSGSVISVALQADPKHAQEMVGA
jgi:hypothetical protein